MIVGNKLFQKNESHQVIARLGVIKESNISFTKRRVYDPA